MFYKFQEVVSDLDLSYAVSLSMDGPAVNWKFHKQLQTELSDEFGGKQLLNVGSCGLHTIHNCFKTCFEEWHLEKVLTSLYHLFKHSPARREDFSSLNQQSETLFPRKFCGHRWLENGPAVERALDMWNDIKAYVKAVKEKKLPRPACASYDVIAAAIEDPLIQVKLRFFLSIEMQVKPFLAKYQTDAPMIPFLSTALFELIKGVMRRVVVREKLSDLTCTSMAHFGLEEENLLSYSEVDVGFSANSELNQLVRRKKNGVSERDALAFRMQCRQGIVAMLKKMLAKSPLQFEVVTAVSCFDPRKLATDPSGCAENLALLLKRMLRAKLLQRSIICESVEQQFHKFCDEVAHDDDFRGFDQDENRVDTLYASKLQGKKEFKELWSVVQMALLLSHGQASVERGFSVNKETLQDNQMEASVVANGIICDAVRDCGGIQNVNISKEMMSYVKNARMKYRRELEAKKEKEKDEEKGRKRKAMEDELGQMKKKTKMIQNIIDEFEEKSDGLLKDAESQGPQKMAKMLTEALALREKRTQKQNQLKELKEDITSKEKDLKDI